jgi:hypothetical protein
MQREGGKGRWRGEGGIEVRGKRWEEVYFGTIVCVLEVSWAIVDSILTYLIVRTVRGGRGERSRKNMVTYCNVVKNYTSIFGSVLKRRQQKAQRIAFVGIFQFFYVYEFCGYKLARWHIS